MRMARAQNLLGLEPGLRDILMEPLRELMFRIPVKLDSGEVRVFTAYRVVHNDALGPSKDGTRIAPNLTLDEVKSLLEGDAATSSERYASIA